MNDLPRVSKALELIMLGFPASKIKTLIESSSGYPSLRTVQYWLSKIGQVSLELLEEDFPIEWHKLDQLGFDWEVGKLLYRINSEGEGNPSIRYIRWCVRISTVRPDAPISFVKKIARQCVIDDHAEMLGLSKLNRNDAWKTLGEAEFATDFEELRGKYAVLFLDKGRPLPDWITNDGLLSIVRDENGTTVICSQNELYLDEAMETDWTALRLKNTDVTILETLMKKTPVRFVSTAHKQYVLIRKPSADGNQLVR